MGGMLRCDSCGSIRWAVLGVANGRTAKCETCGEPLKPERRRPGRRARRFDGERRGLSVRAPAPPPRV